MKKVKKVNGYLIVKFNDQERQRWAQLGDYGVIDAELYTGDIDVDRGVLKYENAETLESAIEQALGLEPLDTMKERITIVHETDEDTFGPEGTGPDPAALFIAMRERLARQIKSPHYPDTDERTAAHELYGYTQALKDLGHVKEFDAQFSVTLDTFKGVQSDH